MPLDEDVSGDVEELGHQFSLTLTDRSLAIDYFEKCRLLA
jgi:hypothetical protein